MALTNKSGVSSRLDGKKTFSDNCKAALYINEKKDLETEYNGAVEESFDKTPEVVVEEVTEQHIKPQMQKQTTMNQNMVSTESLAPKFQKLVHKKRGAQRSVYLDGEVNDYLDEKMEKFGIKASSIINTLIKEQIEREKQQ